VYGIDMPSPQELVAHGRDEHEIAEEIGADLVIFQKLDDLIKSCTDFNPDIKTLDCSVFTGEYVTGGVDERYLEHIAKLRNDKAKAKKRSKAYEEAEVEESCSGPMSEWT
jgi:amidophosphoribosyltransferase